MAGAGAEAALGQAGDVRVVLERGAGNLEVLADPVRQGEIIPTLDLIGFLDAATDGVDGAAEANADGFDVLAKAGNVDQQRPDGGFDLLENAGGAAFGIDFQRFKARSVPCPNPIPSWSLVPPISMPRTGGSAMLVSELLTRRSKRPPWRRSGGRGRR